ncbi:MFS transporter [Candidatus Falkowbacteria bacterium]|nr:MFS transporter [Candidatus Falkowbacteria bacterium]
MRLNLESSLTITERFPMEKVKRNYLLFTICEEIPHALVFPVYVIFLVDNGMTMAQVGIINFVFMLAIFAFEIPTGVIADYFGRKISVLTGLFFHALSTLIYFASYGMFGFIIAELTCAVGSCFISGALDAWVKDAIDNNGGGDCGHVFSRGEIARTLSYIAGGTIGAGLMLIDLRLPWILSAIGLFVSIPISNKLLTEEHFVRKRLTMREGWNGMKKIFVDSVRYGLNNKPIFALICVGVFFTAACQAINMNWTLYFKSKFGIASVSWGWAMIGAASMVGILIGSKLINNKAGKIRTIKLSLIANVVVFACMAAIPNAGIVMLFFLAHEISRGAFTPAERSFLQENILSSDIRATVGSFKSMIIAGAAAISWLGCGILLTVWSFETLLLISAGLTFVAAMFTKRLQ